MLKRYHGKALELNGNLVSTTLNSYRPTDA